MKYIFLFLVSLGFVHGQNWDAIIKGDKAWLILRDNELERNDEGKDEPFFVNPLLVDGKPLDYNKFNLRSKGILKVVRGNPESKERTEIPFIISLRRNNTIISPSDVSIFNQELYEVELSEIMKNAKMNDELIIRPVKREHYKAKRILNLIR